MGDLGVKATYAILDDLRKKVKEQHIKEPIECRELLIDSIKQQMDVGETAYEFENQTSVCSGDPSKWSRKDDYYRKTCR